MNSKGVLVSFQLGGVFCRAIKYSSGIRCVSAQSVYRRNPIIVQVLGCWCLPNRPPQLLYFFVCINTLSMIEISYASNSKLVKLSLCEIRARKVEREGRESDLHKVL
jgi:hypothetical protein